MSAVAERRQRQAALLLGVIGALAGLGWWRLLRSLGVHATSDSAAYFLSALRLSWGQGELLSPSWPPLYPGLIWLSDHALLYPTDSAALIAGLAAGMLVGGLGASALAATRSPAMAASAALFCCGWGAMLFVFRYAWSEPLYTGLAMVHVAFIARHMRSDRLRDYALASVFAAAAASTRYIGYSLVAVLALYTLVYLLRTRADLRTWGRHAAAGILPLLPLAAWLARNLKKSGHLHGERSPARRTLSENTGYLLDTLGEQLWSAPLMSGLLVGAVLLAAAGQREDPSSPSARLVRYVLACALLYVGLLLYATSTVAMDRISPRLTMPVLPLAVLFIVVAIGSVLPALPTSGQRVLSALAAAALACAAVGNLPACRHALSGAFDAVGGSSSHELSGFNASRTADELSALLALRLHTQPHLAATVMTQARSGHKGLSLWTRRATFEEPGLSLVRYVGFSNQRLTIELAHTGQPRTLSVWLHGSLQSPADITAELVDMIQNTGENEVMVITRAQLLRKVGVPGASLASLPDPLVRCAMVDEIDPYQVYSCAQQAAPALINESR
ncbi:MAG: hypothetical protein ACI8S6_000673 [Myxococcota bacterium]|jgi:hypothetical protein